MTIPLEGVQWIEASAGTGKTFTIASLYLRLLLERELSPREILVVTYTRAATAELRDRLRERIRHAREALRRETEPEPEPLRSLWRSAREQGLREVWSARLERALQGFDEAAVFTVHGFCQRVLEDRAFESGADFERELLPDATPLVDDLAHDFWAAELHDAPEALLAGLRRQQLSPASLARLAGFLLANPDARILPETTDPVDFAAVGARFDAALERARKLWEAEREAIVELLCTHPKLHGGTYRAEKVRGEWSAQLDDAFAAAQPGLEKTCKFLPRIAQGGFRVNKGGVEPEHPFFEACRALVEADAAWREQLVQARIDLELRFARALQGSLGERKRELRSFTYDDLLTSLSAALDGPLAAGLVDSLRSQFAVALVDEFQDTDPIQWQIFDRVWGAGGAEASGGEAALFLIGDPKQAIYGFRGADVHAYLRAKRSVPPEARHSLDTNWRSSAGLIRALNTLFESVQRPFEHEEIDYVAVEPSPRAPADDLGRPALRLLRVESGSAEDGGAGRAIDKGRAERELPPGVAADIARWLAAPPDGGAAVSPRDFAVLCRSNAQARAIQEALRSFGVPSVLHSDSSVFDSVEAEWLERLLRALVEPGDARRLRAALATPLLGVDADGLMALAEDERAWEDWLGRVRRWSALWRREGIMPALRTVQVECASMERLVRQPAGERALTNLRHLAELLQSESSRGHHGPASLLRWLAQLRRDSAARSDVEEDTQLRLESDARAVQLVTIHKSKGLEYEIVYCPYAWTSAQLFPEEKKRPRFHDALAGDRLTLDLGSDSLEEHRALAEEEALAEGLRLLYVALTRARRHCSVVWGRFRDAPGSALARLLHTGDVKELDDDALRKDLEALAGRSRGTIGVEALAPASAPRYHEPHEEPARLSARALARQPVVVWRSSSFSALTRVDERARGPAAEGRDYDDESGFDLPDRPAADAGRAGADAPAGEDPSDRVRLADFPAGARPGTLLHEILEHCPFAGLAARSEEGAIETALRRHGVSTAFAAELSVALAEVVGTALPDPGAGAPFRLADLAPGSQKAELEFALPLPAPGLRAEALAAAFATASSPWVRRYAETVAELGFRPVEGSLRGFVDLVFEHRGRYYLLDYKSNHLGPQRRDYGIEALGPAMVEHHYVLQYHLYWIALQRYLALRVPGFDYERHMGGVLYLFLRGMAPGSDTGVYVDRPERALAERLSEALRGAAAGGSRRGSAGPEGERFERSPGRPA